MSTVETNDNRVLLNGSSGSNMRHLGHPGTDGQRAYNDRNTRRRDPDGNRLPGSYAYGHPTPDEARVEETPLIGALGHLAGVEPVIAGWLHYFYNHRLLTRLRECREARDEAEYERRLPEVIQEEIDRDQNEQRALSAAASQPHRDAALALDGALESASLHAVARSAAIGRSFDPAAPTTEEALRVEVPDLSTFAAAEGLADPRGDAGALLPKGIVTVLTALVGTLIGISFGVIGHALEAAELITDWLPALLFAGIGYGVACFTRQAIVLFHRQAAERHYLGRDARHCLPVLVGALLFDVVVIVVDVVTEARGVLQPGVQSAMEVETLRPGSGGRNPAGDLLLYLVPLLITAGYVAYSAWEGYLQGRSTVLMNRLLRAQDEELERRRTAHLSDPRVQEALAAILALQEVLRQKEEHLARAAAAERPFLERIATLELRRVPLQLALSTEQRARIQDRHDDLRGTCLEFDAAFLAAAESLRSVAGPSAGSPTERELGDAGGKRPGFFRRLWDALARLLRRWFRGRQR